MKGLYKRGKKYWMAYSVNGQMRFESTGVTTRRDAEYILGCRRKEIKDGNIPEIRQVKNYKFAELAQNYSKWAERQRIFKTKRIWIKQLVEVFGNLDVKDMDTRTIEQWQSKRLKYNKPATVNRVLACLKHMVNKGVQWEMANEETLKKVRNVKLLEENNERLRFLTVEECQTLIDCCSTHLKPIVTVALHTGMRKGEILGLKWEQVDLKHGFILLDTTKNGERKEIPIDNTLRRMFEDMPHSIESVYVFTDKDGNPYKSVKRSFSTAMNKAGIRDFRFHDLRHTFASHLVMNGIDLTSVKELLGHKSLKMTLRYAHLAPGHKMKAVNILDNVLTKPHAENTQLDNYLTVFNSEEPTTYPKSLFDNMGDTGLEPVTPCLSNEGTAFFTNFITA
ncbi:MAG: tyrosine-type recombinase/integrase [Planctomycetota bacterium]|jgi:integrase